METEPQEVQKRRRRKLRTDDSHPDACVVCGDQATGYNFDAFTCSSCKVFFRRTANNMVGQMNIYTLKRLCTLHTGDCEITQATRTRCPPCRMRRCLQMGMKPEWITPISRLIHRSNFNPQKSSIASSSTQSIASSQERFAFEPNHNIKEEATLHPSEVFVSSPSSCIMERPLKRMLEHLFTSYTEQIQAAVDIIMAPMMEDEVERYDMRQETPTTESTHNAKEISVIRLVQAIKTLPAFQLLTKSARKSLMKEAMRGMSALFFVMHFDTNAMVAIYNYVTTGGELRCLRVNLPSTLNRLFHSLPSSYLSVILAVFMPSKADNLLHHCMGPLTSATLLDLMDSFPCSSSSSSSLDDLFICDDGKFLSAEHPSTSSYSDTRQFIQPSISVKETSKSPDMADQVAACLNQTLYEICHATECNPMLLTTVCVLRLFRVDEDSSRLTLNLSDRFLVQKTRFELEWFLLQYAQQLWSSQPQSSSSDRSVTDRITELNLVFNRLELIENAQLHMEYLMRRDQITPLMKEFLPDETTALDKP